MTTPASPVISADHSVVSADVTTIAPKKTTYAGRVWTAVTLVSDAASKIVSSSDPMDKVGKFISGVCLTTMVVLRNSKLAVISDINAAAREFSTFTSATCVFDRLNVFTSGEYLKKSVWKNLSTACLVVSKSTEGLLWVSHHGGYELGRIASAIGGSRLYSATRLFTADIFRRSFVITACTFAIVDSALTMAQADGDVFRCLLAVSQDMGKIGLTALTAYWFSIPFGLLATATGAIGLTKILYDAYQQ